MLKRDCRLHDEGSIHLRLNGAIGAGYRLEHNHEYNRGSCEWRIRFHTNLRSEVENVKEG